MRQRLIRYTATITAALMLSACATTGANDASLTPDQRALRDHTANYTATGAVAGAALGCLAGVLLSGKNKGAGCAAGAVAGGALGAGVGYYQAQRQNAVGQQSVDYRAERDALNREVEKTKTTVAAAHRITVEAKNDISRLKRQAASSQANQRQLEERVRLAKDDHAEMEKVAKGIQGTIDQLEQDIRSGHGGKNGDDHLDVKRRQLIEERNKLQRDMRALDGIIDDSGAKTS
jgi:uncharacterized protein HemX